MTIEEVLSEAIKTRTPVVLSRHQDKGRQRYVCPHAFGYSEAGLLNVFCYQYDGYSSGPLGPSGSPQNWRCYCVKDIAQAELTVGQWHSSNAALKPTSCVVRPLQTLL
jgi:hypothetical protein